MKRPDHPAMRPVHLPLTSVDPARVSPGQQEVVISATTPHLDLTVAVGVAAPSTAAEPALLLADVEREDMVVAVRRLFERHFAEDAAGLLHDVGPDERDATLCLADFVYVDRGGALHLIQIQRTFDAAFFDLHDGLHALTTAAANAGWLALPLDAYRAGNELFGNRIETFCAERGIGIVGIHRCGRGISARIHLEASPRPGRFLAEHPELEAAWRLHAKGIVSGLHRGDYLVVSDHVGAGQVAERAKA